MGGVIGEALRLRRSSPQGRNDFINHLLELQKEHNLSEEDMISHAMTFMFDGLDTTSTSIAHCLLLVSYQVGMGLGMYLWRWSILCRISEDLRD